MPGIIKREDNLKERMRIIAEGESRRPDDTEFKTACKLFRDVCAEIQEFIGDSTFKGGFDDYEKFLNSDASKNDPMQSLQLSQKWSGANEYAKYEGSKIGFGQPEWWYECWKEQ